jgi:hypothetical protein
VRVDLLQQHGDQRCQVQVRLRSRKVYFSRLKNLSEMLLVVSLKRSLWP